MYFDAHADVFTDITCRRLLGEKNVFEKHHFDKYKKSGIDASIFVIWVDPPYDRTPVARFQQIIENVEAELKEADNVIYQVKNMEGFAEAKSQGKLAVMIGSEGLSYIGNDVSKLEYLYHQVGIRHASLTWNEENELATGVKGDPDRGLTKEGKEAINKMEELGMVVDVSHLNESSFWGVMELVTKPVIASHSNCKVLCPIMRNLSDEQIIAIAQTGGVVGMNSYQEFTSYDPEKRNCLGLVDHVDRIVELVGIDHVGCGFDFSDFIDHETMSSYSSEIHQPGILDLNSADQAYNFINALEKKGYQSKDIEKIKSKNFMRVFRQILK